MSAGRKVRPKTLACILPPKSCDKVRYAPEIVQKVSDLARELIDDRIADALNKEGLSSSKGGPFTRSNVRNIRWAYRIPSPRLKRPQELTVHEVAQKFKVSSHVVYYWIFKARTRRNLEAESRTVVRA
jgi:hypothetical protein